MYHYIVRIRYSKNNELNDENHYILFERYHPKTKLWEIFKLFQLVYSAELRQYIMPVDVINEIKHLNGLNFDIYYDLHFQNTES